MKQLTLVLLSVITLSSFAQEKSKKHEKMAQIRHEMTPEDIAGIKTKKLVLHLDLSEAQQDQVYNLMLVKTAEEKALRDKRKAKKEDKAQITKDDYIKMQNDQLDRQIAFKREMKAILTNEQYAKFEKIKPRRHRKKHQRRQRAK